MAMAVRVRFAPSPTGSLHLGGFRTALLNYVFARKHNGKFLLRIEDTDQTRIVPGAVERLEDDLEWLGLPPDESPRKGGRYGPYVQSQRLNIYSDFVKRLIESSSAYECFCTKKRLDLIRKEAVRAKAVPGYDNKCRELTRSEVVQKKSSGESFVIRLKVSPTPVELNDMLYGTIHLSDMRDPVILKSDGFPTYHLANVVDDHLMEISHVLRGVEWQVSTGIHLQLYRALKLKPPKFAHLPVLLNKDGTKLSKRQESISIKNYRDEECSPLCLTNFVTKSGGGFYHNVDKLQTMDEICNGFDLDKLNTNSCRLDFNLLDELNRVNTRHQLETNFGDLLKNLKLKHPSESEDYLKRILLWSRTRVTNLKELEEMHFLWSHPTQYNLKTCTNLLDKYKNSDLTRVNDFIYGNDLNARVFLKDLRFILCGLKEGPPVVELIELLGHDLVKLRIENAISSHK